MTLLLVLAGCPRREAPRESQTTPATVTPSAAPSATLPPSASAPNPSARRAVAAIPCKGVEKGKLTSIGAQAGQFAGLAVDAGNAYLLAFDQLNARATLKRLPRDGRNGAIVGASKSASRPGSLRVDERAAYFVHGKELRKISLSGGEATTLLADVKGPVALAEQALWVVRCNVAEKKDELVSVSSAGGEPRVRASWPRSGSGKDCDYGDIAIDKDDFFLGDATNRRILGISRADGSLRELSVKQPYPQRIAIESEHLVFQASSGLFRVKKSAGPAEKISRWGATPFHFFAWDDHQFFVFNGEAYGTRHTLLVLPPSGGEGKELEWFAIADVVSGSGVSDIAVDDACVYLAKYVDRYVEILARPKP